MNPVQFSPSQGSSSLVLSPAYYETFGTLDKLSRLREEMDATGTDKKKLVLPPCAFIICETFAFHIAREDEANRRRREKWR